MEGRRKTLSLIRRLDFWVGNSWMSKFYWYSQIELLTGLISITIGGCIITTNVKDCILLMLKNLETALTEPERKLRAQMVVHDSLVWCQVLRSFGKEGYCDYCKTSQVLDVLSNIKNYAQSSVEVKYCMFLCLKSWSIYIAERWVLLSWWYLSNDKKNRKSTTQTTLCAL